MTTATEQRKEPVDDMIHRWMRDDRRQDHTARLFDQMTDTFIDHYEGKMTELELHAKLEELTKRMTAWNRHCQKILNPPD